MGSSCFFLDRKASDKRPAAPFPRTTISLVGATRPFVLQRNRVPVPPEQVKDYLFFDLAREQIGAYPLALHHSIPFNLLKSSWDPIVLFCTKESIKALWDHYCQDHPTVKEKPDEVAAFTRKLFKLRDELGPKFGGAPLGTKTFEAVAKEAYAAVAKDATPDAFTSDEASAMEVILCWGSWNLTEGPEGAIRIEDPGEAYDEFLACCPDESFKVRYRAVARLNAALQKISDDYDKGKGKPLDASIAQAWTDELMEALRVCQAVTASQRKLVYLNPLMWAPVATYGGVDRKGYAKLNPNAMMTIEIQSKWYWRQYKCGRY